MACQNMKVCRLYWMLSSALNCNKYSGTTYWYFVVTLPLPLSIHTNVFALVCQVVKAVHALLVRLLTTFPVDQGTAWLSDCNIAFYSCLNSNISSIQRCSTSTGIYSMRMQQYSYLSICSLLLLWIILKHCIDMINAVYHDKPPLIVIVATFWEKLISIHQIVNINYWIRLS